MRRLERGSHEARAMEWGLVLLFIALLTWLVLSRFDALEHQALSTIAQHEYRLLETRIQVYRIRNGHWPKTLKQAVQSKEQPALIRHAGTRRDRLFTADGAVLNPYGRPYRYDPVSGELKRPTALRDVN